MFISWNSALQKVACCLLISIDMIVHTQKFTNSATYTSGSTLPILYYKTGLSRRNWKVGFCQRSKRVLTSGERSGYQLSLSICLWLVIHNLILFNAAALRLPTLIWHRMSICYRFEQAWSIQSEKCSRAKLGRSFPLIVYSGYIYADHFATHSDITFNVGDALAAVGVRTARHSEHSDKSSALV